MIIEHILFLTCVRHTFSSIFLKKEAHKEHAVDIRNNILLSRYSLLIKFYNKILNCNMFVIFEGNISHKYFWHVVQDKKDLFRQYDDILLCIKYCILFYI